MKRCFSLALLGCGLAAALPQQQPQPQPQPQQQPQPQPAQGQPQQCTPDVLSDLMVTSPVETTQNKENFLPSGASFVGPASTTILLGGGQQNQLQGVKFGDLGNASVQVLHDSAFAISWIQVPPGQQPGQPAGGGQQQQVRGAQAQPPAQQQPPPAQPQQQPAQQQQPAKQQQQPASGGQPAQPRFQITPTQVQLVDSKGNVRNVTEVLGFFGTAEHAQSGGGQPGVATQQAPQQPPPNATGPQQPQPQNATAEPEPGMPDNAGGVIVYVGPEIPPGMYAFMLHAQLKPGGAAGGKPGAQVETPGGKGGTKQGGQVAGSQAAAPQPGPQQGQQQGQQAGITCSILTHPFRVRSVEELMQSGKQRQA